MVKKCGLLISALFMYVSLLVYLFFMEIFLPNRLFVAGTSPNAIALIELGTTVFSICSVMIKKLEVYSLFTIIKKKQIIKAF